MKLSAIYSTQLHKRPYPIIIFIYRLSIMTINQRIPTRLIVGQQQQVDQYVESLLKKALCKNSLDNCYCSDCRKIGEHQHHNVVWISPEKDYKTEDIDIIFERARYTLDDDQQFFFVLEHADTLNRSSANKLLKILEEPPRGYHFILLTPNEDALLPTIISRCAITRLHNNQLHEELHPLLTYFVHPIKRDDPFEFELELKKYHFSSSESISLAHELLNHFSRIIQTFHTSKRITQEDYLMAQRTIEFLQNKLKKPPQSGSSALFWKNLFMQFPRTS